MSGQIALTEAVYYILLSLCEPRHGYGIMKRTQELSGGRVMLAAGTLYGALSTLCEKGWIRPTDGGEGRQKAYGLTEQGAAILLAEFERLKSLVKSGETVLGGAEDDENRA